MKVISCIGYHDTGSGAVDDFLREFDNIAQASYGVECRFLQDPDCVSDLEYNIVENPHRLNTGYALKRYKRFVDKNMHTYGLIFGSAWKDESYKYIESLTEFDYKGYWSGDMMLMSNFKVFTYYFRRAINKFVPKKYKKPSTWNYFPKERTLHCDLTSEEFLAKTRDYVSALLKVLNPEDKEFVVLDQAASAMNITRYLRYFNEDTRMIVVDRDPRDIFIEETLLKGRVLPKDAKDFCRVYATSRRRVDNATDSKNVLFMHFEDIIYHYEETADKLMKFAGLSENDRNPAMRRLHPEISIKNTKLWEKHPEFSEDVKIIEQELKDYLYQY